MKNIIMMLFFAAVFAAGAAMSVFNPTNGQIELWVVIFGGSGMLFYAARYADTVNISVDITVDCINIIYNPTAHRHIVMSTMYISDKLKYIAATDELKVWLEANKVDYFVESITAKDNEFVFPDTEMLKARSRVVIVGRVTELSDGKIIISYITNSFPAIDDHAPYIVSFAKKDKHSIDDTIFVSNDNILWFKSKEHAEDNIGWAIKPKQTFEPDIPNNQMIGWPLTRQ